MYCSLIITTVIGYDVGLTPDVSAEGGHGFTHDDPFHGAAQMADDFFRMSPPQEIDASQLGGAPINPTQQSQDPVATPVPPQGRDRHPPDPLTYPTRQTRAAMRRVTARAAKRGRV